MPPVAGLVWCFSHIVGRGLDPAEHSRRAKSPALQTGGNGQRTGNPARGAPLPGGIYASPTNTRYRVHKPKNVTIRQTPTGRMHAAPTNRPGTAGEQVRRVFTATGRGGVKTPPYKWAQTVGFPATPAWSAPLPGGIVAFPTNKGTAYTHQMRYPGADVRPPPVLHAAAKNAGRRAGKNRAFCPLPTAPPAGIIGA